EPSSTSARVKVCPAIGGKRDRHVPPLVGAELLRPCPAAKHDPVHPAVPDEMQFGNLQRMLPHGIDGRNKGLLALDRLTNDLPIRKLRALGALEFTGRLLKFRTTLAVECGVEDQDATGGAHEVHVFSSTRCSRRRGIQAPQSSATTIVRPSFTSKTRIL